jgi:hypothetical protein
MKHIPLSEQELFARPLIIGASISAGHRTGDGGPGTVLARRLNPRAQITNYARNGATSVQAITGLDLNALSPTIVLGFDLFFWDVARNRVGPEFEVHTRRFFAALARQRIPLIVGKLPLLDLPLGPLGDGFRRSALRVNALLDELCAAHGRALAYDPLECLMRMLGSPKFFSDGLHLTREGNEFCAGVFLESRPHRSFCT